MKSRVVKKVIKQKSQIESIVKKIDQQGQVASQSKIKQNIECINLQMQ